MAKAFVKALAVKKSWGQVVHADKYLRGELKEQVEQGIAKTENEIYSALNCHRDNFSKSAMLYAKMYNKKPTRKAYEFVQSFDPKDIQENGLNPELAHKIGMQFARKIADDYPVLVTTHIDTLLYDSPDLDNRKIISGKKYVEGMKIFDSRGNELTKEQLHIKKIKPGKEIPGTYHNQILIANVNVDTGKSFQYSDRTLESWKEYAAQLCSNEKLTYSLDSKREKQTWEKTTSNERLMNSNGKKTVKDTVRDFAMQCMTESKDFNTFITAMKNKNIDVIVRGKSVSFAHPDLKKNIRGKSLAEDLQDVEHIVAAIEKLRQNESKEVHHEVKEQAKVNVEVAEKPKMTVRQAEEYKNTIYILQSSYKHIQNNNAEMKQNTAEMKEKKAAYETAKAEYNSVVFHKNGREDKKKLDQAKENYEFAKLHRESKNQELRIDSQMEKARTNEVLAKYGKQIGSSAEIPTIIDDFVEYLKGHMIENEKEVREQQEKVQEESRQEQGHRRTLEEFMKKASKQKENKTTDKEKGTFVRNYKGFKIYKKNGKYDIWKGDKLKHTVNSVDAAVHKIYQTYFLQR